MAEDCIAGRAGATGLEGAPHALPTRLLLKRSVYGGTALPAVQTGDPEHNSCFYTSRKMRDPDFFAYCTGLKLLELKAIGELSSVQHLPEGETIYSTGDPGDALFIINRGVVEVIH